MEYESNKFSIRVQDALSFNSILSQIYSLLYINYYGFLTSYSSIVKESKEIKNAVLNKLADKNIQEKILEIYVNNDKFFNKKYKIKNSELDAVKTNVEKGNIILGKIIDTIKIVPTNFPGVENINSPIDLIFKDNIFNCPIIKQYEVSNSKYYDTTSGFADYQDFFSSPLYAVKDRFSKDKSDVIYLTHIDPEIRKKGEWVDDKDEGFHFELFLSFDFDRTKYVFSGGDGELLNKPKIYYDNVTYDKLADEQVPVGIDGNGNIIYQKVQKKVGEEIVNQEVGELAALESFFYSNINLGFFLSLQDPIVKNIVINPKYFQTLFPKINDSYFESAKGVDKSNTHYIDKKLKVQDYKARFIAMSSNVKKFISNVRLGLRLVHRKKPRLFNDINGLSIYQINKEKNFDFGKKYGYAEEAYYISTAQKIVEDSTLKNKAIKGNVYFNNKPYTLFSSIKGDKIVKEAYFSPLEQIILKEKSHILFFQEQGGKFWERQFTPIVAVYDPPIAFSSTEDIYNYIENSDSAIERLKQKMLETEEFKYIFEKIFPINLFYSLINIDAGYSMQEKAEAFLVQPPTNALDTGVARIAAKSLKNVTDNLNKNPGKY